MLVEAGGKDLLMLTTNSSRSCLSIAAEHGNDDVVQVQ